ncbi:uncharacterized protein LOC132554862 [Ylistrum balloti]|uniref:uncharacterized protein LOC132554862 n=1 Tax=Ylistrum balloti TaxID=509963 RepID=UPI002905E582|nr:uncharacterized protein LOC132554862 [Ylistrum balloti]
MRRPGRRRELLDHEADQASKRTPGQELHIRLCFRSLKQETLALPHHTRVSATQRRAISDTTYLRLVEALCSDDDGLIRKSCLQNVSKGTFIDDIFSRLFDQGYGGKNNRGGRRDVEDIGRAETLSMKRGRERTSGFYSNW